MDFKAKLDTAEYGKTTADKAYIQAQAWADQLSMSIMHHLNTIEAFRDRNEDTWASVGTMTSIISKLEEVEREISRYCDLRVKED